MIISQALSEWNVFSVLRLDDVGCGSDEVISSFWANWLAAVEDQPKSSFRATKHLRHGFLECLLCS